MFQCISRGVVVIEACYLHNLEKHPVRPSIRITSNRLLSTVDIDNAFRVIEEVTKEAVQ